MASTRNWSNTGLCACGSAGSTAIDGAAGSAIRGVLAGGAIGIAAALIASIDGPPAGSGLTGAMDKGMSGGLGWTAGGSGAGLGAAFIRSIRLCCSAR